MSSTTGYLINPSKVGPMSGCLKGLSFLFVPNNNAKITAIRKSLARDNGAIVNTKFLPNVTTHVLVDRIIIQNAVQILKVMGVNQRSEAPGVPILNQTWLLDSIEKQKLLDYDNYEIDVPDDLVVNSAKRHKLSSTETPKSPTTMTKTQMLEDAINASDIEDNPNTEVMELLKEMATEREVNGDVFKARAYRIAVDSLSKTNTHITTKEQALRLPGVGKSIADKIEEISQTHGLEVLKDLKGSEVSKLRKLFQGVYGVGAVFAQKWIKEGMRTLEDLEKRDDLTHNQRLGLTYYEDWNLEISRDECTAHKQYLQDIVKDIDPEVEFTIGGSYRRGAAKCGDIDFMITKPDAEIDELRLFLKKLLAKMKKTGYHKCTLTISISSRWSGGCALPSQYLKQMGYHSDWNRCRRVDFLLVPWKERGAAFIYFTGNNDFNKKIRLRALKRGMVLNGNGLFKRTLPTQKGGEKTLTLLEGFDEKKIFEILDVRWREPWERNLGSYEPIGKASRKLGVKSKKI